MSNSLISFLSNIKSNLPFQPSLPAFLKALLESRNTEKMAGKDFHYRFSSSVTGKDLGKKGTQN